MLSGELEKQMKLECSIESFQIFDTKKEKMFFLHRILFPVFGASKEGGALDSTYRVGGVNLSF